MTPQERAEAKKAQGQAELTCVVLAAVLIFGCIKYVGGYVDGLTATGVKAGATIGLLRGLWLLITYRYSMLSLMSSLIIIGASLFLLLREVQ